MADGKYKASKLTAGRWEAYVDELNRMPDHTLSETVPGLTRLTEPFVIGTGDMWPITWADDDNLYTAGGDNYGFGPSWDYMNIWKITGAPPDHDAVRVNSCGFANELVRAGVAYSIKPAGILSVGGILYLAVEHMFSTAGRYGNQVYTAAWVIVSGDHGKTWSPVPDAKGREFFTGRFASPHFLQFGRDYSGARDGYVYAYSTAGDDGVACWSAGDEMFLGRAAKADILSREAWEFYRGEGDGKPQWTPDLSNARPVFRYPRKTGENEVVYNPGIGRYLLLNWAFIDCVNHRIGSRHSELTVFEAPEPWGPWALVYRESNWGPNCDYQPRMPTKWMSRDGRTAWILSSGNFQRDGGPPHYGLVVSKIQLGTGNRGDIRPQETPGAVRGVEAAALNDSEIRVSWLADERARFYRVSRDGKKLLDVGMEARPPMLVDRGLPSNRTFSYAVQAFDADGNSGPVSRDVAAATTPPLADDWIGVNLQGPAVVAGGRVWQGQGSSHVEVSADNYSVDQRIQTQKLKPDSGDLEPLLRSSGGQRSVGSQPQVTCRIPRPDRGEEEARVWVFAVDLKACGTTTSFDLWIQGTRVAEFRSSSDRNWERMGPYAVRLAPAQALVIEGTRFLGAGGIAAVEVKYSAAKLPAGQ